MTVDLHDKWFVIDESGHHIHVFYTEAIALEYAETHEATVVSVLKLWGESDNAFIDTIWTIADGRIKQ